MSTVDDLIREAIRAHRRLELEYDGLPRLIEPYCYGESAAGSPLLRAIQVGGASRSARRGFGKLWTVEKMRSVRLSEQFVPDDPHYNPDDTAMATIYCRV